jgi:hypothetical protein
VIHFTKAARERMVVPASSSSVTSCTRAFPCLTPPVAGASCSVRVGFRAAQGRTPQPPRYTPHHVRPFLCTRPLPASISVSLPQLTGDPSDASASGAVLGCCSVGGDERHSFMRQLGGEGSPHQPSILRRGTLTRCVPVAPH